jgi:hypothetical protein
MRNQQVSIVNLSTYTSPKVTEIRNKDWVAYGDDNDYFQYLIDRYNGSATNNAIINGISEMIFGKGLDATDSNRKPDEYAQMVSLFNKDCVRKLAYDLKLMGQCAMQIIYSKDRNTIAQVEHFPIETLRAEKANEDGDIEAYYYFSDWKKIKPNDKPERIPAFGYSNAPIEILYVKPYRAGFYYYSPVDYQGGLQYAELEEEISNYHLNNILNGLAPSMLINFNNGTPNEEERELIERRIYQKFSGSSNAGKFILAFNDDPAQQATIDPIQLSDAHNQYQFLSDESMRKIMVSHRVVSPMLLGIKDQSGLGNNADELKTASILMDNTVIRPFQTLLIDAFEKVLSYNDISLNLYFKTLQPLEFTDLEGTMVDEETREEETGVKMSINESKEKMCTHLSSDKDFNDKEIFEKLKELGEEEDLEEWEIVDERPVDYDQEEALDKMIGLVSAGSPDADAKSSQDRALFKVRYQYAPIRNSANSREFCRLMEDVNLIYRKEDIIQMNSEPVNAGFGPDGADTYNIWFYKGGSYCHHFWKRKTYMRKRNPQGQFLPNEGLENDKNISVNEAEAQGFTPTQNNPKVAMRPVDMPNGASRKNR